MTFPDALLHLWSFSHSACDSAIAKSGHGFPNRYSDLSLYGGFPFITECFVFRPVGHEYLERRKRGLRTWPYLCVVPPFVIVLVVVLYGSQVATITDYVSTCRAVLDSR